MDIEKLLSEIIPPNDYEHRNGFSNKSIIDGLSTEEKGVIEEQLIKKLELGDEDLLIVETLSYLKSEKALPLLYELLNKSSDDRVRIIIAVSIFDINQDDSLVNIAIESFKKIESIKDAYFVFRLLSAFYYLSRFKDERANELIAAYTDHGDFLLSYNAKIALGLK